MLYFVCIFVAGWMCKTFIAHVQLALGRSKGRKERSKKGRSKGRKERSEERNGRSKGRKN